MKKLRKTWRKIFFELYFYPERAKKYHTFWLWSKTVLKERRKDKKKRQYANTPRKYHRISKARRLEFYNKQGRYCRYCGTTEHLTIDHIIPVSVSKINKEENWQVLCSNCNTLKADSYLQF